MHALTGVHVYAAGAAAGTLDAAGAAGAAGVAGAPSRVNAGSLDAMHGGAATHRRKRIFPHQHTTEEPPAARATHGRAGAA